MKIISVALLFAVWGGSATRPASAQLPHKPSIRIETVLENPVVCRTAGSLHLRLTLLNEGSEDVIIDSNRLSYTAGFIALIDTSQMTFRNDAIAISGDDIGRQPPPSKQTIHPKGFFSMPISIALQNKLFVTDGYYRLNVASSVAANSPASVEASSTFLFQIRSCDH